MNRYLALSFFVVFLGATLTVAQDVDVATTIVFTEGPTADPLSGDIFFTDQANNRIMRLAANGRVSTYRQPANYANGLVFDPQWRLISCESGDPLTGTPPRITRTYLATGRVEILARPAVGAAGQESSKHLAHGG